ncbi:fatty-acid-binding protein 1 [Cinnamomum micranthum f. kanehirae]|uniref:Fatty-acid-binding protein 1 n=1 Tax=Cinnamomum micranthum f. kanehirae TaxID=337451 RepID=A0A3S3NPH6_9MAGN|nr:fatty-acid-binding protein 1 [Cinnamomum micranthum f. kanehirae]
MASLRFPFLFPQPSNQPPKSNGLSPSSISATAMATSVAAAAVTIGVGMGFAISHKITNQIDPFLQKACDFFASANPDPSSPLWGSLSLAANSPGEPSVEPKTGASFPTVIDGSQRLLGIGLRKKSVLGLKNIDVYAFGVYADDNEIKSLLSEKYGKFLVSELKENKNFYEEVLNQDIRMTVRLQIVYGRLSIRSVRSAFEESVGSRLQKFGGSDNKDLLQRFTSQFKDEYRIPRGSVLDLSKEHGHILRTKIDGKEVGSIQSKLLCRSFLDLYIGEDPFDRHAKEEIEFGLATLLEK